MANSRREQSKIGNYIEVASMNMQDNDSTSHSTSILVTP